MMCGTFVKWMTPHGLICLLQVLLAVNTAGDGDASQLQGWEDLQTDALVIDRGEVVPTDLYVVINLRSGKMLRVSLMCDHT